MPSPKVQLRGWKPDAKRITFILIAREHTGVDLLTAKGWLEQLLDGETVELTPHPDADPKRLGVQMLRSELIEEAVLITDEGRETIVVPPTPTCPSCNVAMVHHCECSHCGWLRFPGNKQRWGNCGACPDCGFSYRWDGNNCSHCGFHCDIQI